MVTSNYLRRRAKSLLANLQEAYACRTKRLKEGIIVLQMGKVGSTSLCASIQASGFRGGVFQVHFLGRQQVNEAIDRIRRSDDPILDRHIFTARHITRRLDRSAPLKVITLTREPLSRAISFVTQDFRRIFEGRPPEGVTEREFALAVKARLASGSPHADPGIWFQRNFEEVLGITLESFNHASSGRCWRGESHLARALCIRMEDLGEEPTSRALSEFVGHKLQLGSERRNLGSNKPAHRLAQQVKGQFYQNREAFREIYETRYISKFYPELQII